MARGTREEKMTKLDEKKVREKLAKKIKIPGKRGTAFNESYDKRFNKRYDER